MRVLIDELSLCRWRDQGDEQNDRPHARVALISRTAVRTVRPTLLRLLGGYRRTVRMRQPTSPSRISAPVIIRSKEPGFRTLPNVLLLVRRRHPPGSASSSERAHREVVTLQILRNVYGELSSWCASRISQVNGSRRQSHATFVNAERGPFRIPCTKGTSYSVGIGTTRGKHPTTVEVGGSTDERDGNGAMVLPAASNRCSGRPDDEHDGQRRGRANKEGHRAHRCLRGFLNRLMRPAA